MKKLFILIFVFASFFAQGQGTPQYIGSPLTWLYQRGKVVNDSGVAIGKDTSFVPTALKPHPWLAAPDSTLYLWVQSQNKWVKAGGKGTVTSVDFTLGSSASSILSITGGPITQSGSFTLGYQNQTQKKFMGSPNSSTGAPTFRAILPSDLGTGTTDGTTILYGDGVWRSASGSSAPDVYIGNDHTWDSIIYFPTWNSNLIIGKTLRLYSTDTKLTVTDHSTDSTWVKELTVNPANILLSSVGGSLNPSQIAQGGATTGQSLVWSGSAWAPTTVTGGGGGETDPLSIRNQYWVQTSATFNVKSGRFNDTLFGPGGMLITDWQAAASSGVAWIDMPTSGPSGIGSGGVGVNPWVARTQTNNQYFPDATSNAIIYRNTAGRMLWGTSGSAFAAMTLDSNTLYIRKSPQIAALKTGVTAPTTSGTIKMVITDANGQLSFQSIPSSSTLADGDYGDITASSTGTVLTIDNSTITNAKRANMAALSVSGNATNASAAPTDIAAANDGEVLRRSGTAVGFGTIATAGIANSAVTKTKFENVTTQTLLGRYAGTTGVMQEITIGSGLSLNSTTGVLTASGASIGDAVADGSTKGQATFTAADFNSSSGNISLDYTNGQKATSSVPGFLSSTDWSTFNGKAPATGGTGYVQNQGTASQAPGSQFWTDDGKVSNTFTVGSGMTFSMSGVNGRFLNGTSNTGTFEFWTHSADVLTLKLNSDGTASLPNYTGTTNRVLYLDASEVVQVSSIDPSNIVVTTGSYSNPSWITALSETKVLPSQSSNSGKFLTTNGTSTSWSTITGFVTAGSNLGSGVGVFNDLSGSTLRFKSLTTPTDGGITLTDNGTSGIAIRNSEYAFAGKSTFQTVSNTIQATAKLFNGVSTNCSGIITVQIVGYRTDGASWTTERKISYKMVSGTASLGAPSTSKADENLGTFGTPTIGWTTINGYPELQITGVASQTIDWVVSYHVTQVVPGS